MNWAPFIQTVTGGALSLTGSIIGVYLTNRYARKRALQERLYAQFVRFHAVASSPSEEGAQIMMDWDKLYLKARVDLEPVADELVVLTEMAGHKELAKRVHALRVEFRRWYSARHVWETFLNENKKSGGNILGKEIERNYVEWTKTYPEKIRQGLAELLHDFRSELGLE